MKTKEHIEEEIVKLEGEAKLYGKEVIYIKLGIDPLLKEYREDLIGFIKTEKINSGLTIIEINKKRIYITYNSDNKEIRISSRQLLIKYLGKEEVDAIDERAKL